MSQQVDRAFLLELLANRFDKEELQTLCFKLEIDFDDLKGEGKEAKARELIYYCQRHGKLDVLIDGIIHQRPDLHIDAEKALHLYEKRSTRDWQENMPARRYERLIGRNREVQHLKSTLGNPSDEPMVLISGLGGTGKTALAFEVAQQCMQDGLFQGLAWETARLHEFVGVDIVLREESIGDYDAFLRSICRQLGLQDTIHPDAARRQGLVRDMFRHAPFLLVLDNLEDVHQEQVWIQRIQELLDPSRALLTSRVLRPSTAGAHHLHLKGLDSDHSVEFMRTEARRRGGNAAVLLDVEERLLREISVATGGMPLAMELVLGQMMLGYVIEDIINGLRSAQPSQEQFYQFIYFNTWKRLTEPAQKLLIATATFEGAVARPMLQGAARMSDSEFTEAVAQLVQASLLETNAEIRSEKVRYDVHPLTRSFVRSDLRGRWRDQETLFPRR